MAVTAPFSLPLRGLVCCLADRPVDGPADHFAPCRNRPGRGLR